MAVGTERSTQYAPGGVVKEPTLYDRVADEYDSAYSSPIDDAEDRFVTKLIQGPSPMRVLDVGCGTGLGFRLCDRVWGDTFFYEGVDPSEKMLARAANRVGAGGHHSDFRCMTAEEYVSRITIPTRPDLILLLYCSPYIQQFGRIVRALAMHGSERARMVITAPAPERFHSGRYGMVRMNSDGGGRVLSYDEYDLDHIVNFVNRTRRVISYRIGSYSGAVARCIPRLLPLEASFARASGLIVRPDFTYAVLELGT